MMSQDLDLDREIALNWRGYIQQSLSSMKDLFKWLWQEFISQPGKKEAKKMFYLLVASCMATISIPWAMSWLFNGLQNQDWRQLVVGWSGFVIITLANVVGVSWRQLHHREILFGHNLRSLNQKTLTLFLEKSLGTHLGENNLLSGSNARKGRERIFNLESLLLFDGLSTLINLTVAFLSMWILNWLAGLIVTLLFIVHLSWGIFLNQQTIAVCVPLDKRWRKMQAYTDERMDEVERVKNAGAEENEETEINRQYDSIIADDQKFWLWFIKQITIREVVGMIFFAAIMAHGVYQVWQGKMTIGLLYPLLAWTGIMQSQLWRVGHIEQQINFCTPAILSLQKILNMPVGLKVSATPKKLEASDLTIKLENVSFVYGNGHNQQEDDQPATIKDVSLTITPGEKVAVVGPSGAGKTTLIRLLLRYHDPVSGIIKINGTPLTDIDLKSWLDLVGYIPQKSQVLDGTVRYNLIYERMVKNLLEPTDEELWQIMRLLQIDFGNRLTAGLDTVVGRHGLQLSGGQAQRLMIGSAVLKDPKFLLIDEATSSLDSTTEKYVQLGLERALLQNKSRSALIITHRLSTVRKLCSRFIMLNNKGEGGFIEASANSFEELAKLSKDFRQLAKDQGIRLRR